MRFFIFLLIFSFSCFALSLDEAKHLLNRTSFAYTKNELEKFQAFSKEEAVDYLIKSAKSKDVYKKPRAIEAASTFNADIRKLSKEEKKALWDKRNKKMQEIKAWWFEMILEPRFSFREKMSLFWHNHFTSEYTIVKSPYMMFLQNELYRENALGSYAKLLHKSSIDMAMLVYLDSNLNKKSEPNENYARELLELFTLGEGNYKEEDIKEAARAFTGLKIDKKKNSFKIESKEHDDGIKVFLGEKGAFDRSDIINIILKQKQSAIFITKKLYKEFINEKYDEKEIERLANIFKKSSYDISILMKNLLLSEAFWAKENRGNMIKSPVEFISSLVKAFSMKLRKNDYIYLVKTSKKLGQDLFNPPSVKGWENNKEWINSNSLINREKFVKNLLNKKLDKRTIKKLSLNDFQEFKNYFYTANINEKYYFQNKKTEYKKFLSQLIYNLK